MNYYKCSVKIETKEWTKEGFLIIKAKDPNNFQSIKSNLIKEYRKSHTGMVYVDIRFVSDITNAGPGVVAKFITDKKPIS